VVESNVGGIVTRLVNEDLLWAEGAGLVFSIISGYASWVSLLCGAFTPMVCSVLEINISSVALVVFDESTPCIILCVQQNLIVTHRKAFCETLENFWIELMAFAMKVSLHIIQRLLKLLFLSRYES